MLKKIFFNSVTGLAIIVFAECLYVRFAAPSMTPVGLLGALSFSGIVAFVVCNVVTTFRYGSDGGGGTGALARLVAALGATIIGCTTFAYLFGVSAALLYVDLGAIAVVATAVMRGLY